jgi:hypothetical protein
MFADAGRQGSVQVKQELDARVEIPLKSFLTPIDPDVRPCHTPLHEGQCSIRQGSMQFYIAG